jgi:hypothetical protein
MAAEAEDIWEGDLRQLGAGLTLGVPDGRVGRDGWRGLRVGLLGGLIGFLLASRCIDRIGAKVILSAVLGLGLENLHLPVELIQLELVLKRPLFISPALGVSQGIALPAPREGPKQHPKCVRHYWLPPAVFGCNIASRAARPPPPPPPP